MVLNRQQDDQCGKDQNFYLLAVNAKVTIKPNELVNSGQGAVLIDRVIMVEPAINCFPVFSPKAFAIIMSLARCRNASVVIAEMHSGLLIGWLLTKGGRLLDYENAGVLPQSALLHRLQRTQSHQQSSHSLQPQAFIRQYFLGARLDDAHQRRPFDRIVPPAFNRICQLAGVTRPKTTQSTPDSPMTTSLPTD